MPRPFTSGKRRGINLCLTRLYLTGTRGSFGTNAIQAHWHSRDNMLPETQTFFSITLFLALSSLLTWKHRRQSRGAVSRTNR